MKERNTQIPLTIGFEGWVGVFVTINQGDMAAHNYFKVGTPYETIAAWANERINFYANFGYKATVKVKRMDEPFTPAYTMPTLETGVAITEKIYLSPDQLAVFDGFVGWSKKAFDCAAAIFCKGQLVGYTSSARNFKRAWGHMIPGRVFVG